MEYERTINGKLVKLKDDIPIAQGRYILKTIEGVSRDDLIGHVAVFQLVIDSWEFDGSPSDEASYEKLGTFKEMLPLIAFVDEWLAQAMGVEQAKNLESASSLPLPSAVA